MSPTIIIVVLLAAYGIGWWRRRRMIESHNGVSMLPTGDRDMEKAIAKARENFHIFVDRLRHPQATDENFSIKAGIRHAGKVEHVWLTDVRVEEAFFSGRIGNDPQMVPYRQGDDWRGDFSHLSDWMFFSNGRMQGNYTLRAMLPRMPAAQREQAQRMLESHWDTRELVHRPWPLDAAMPGRPLPDDLSTGDAELMSSIGKHLDAHLGQGGNVFHEIVSPSAHIDLYQYPATASRPFHVVATTGMAEQAMQLPPGINAAPYVELVLLLPRHWPLDFKSWQDERHWWPLRWLKRVARFHYESGHWLGEGHLLTHGEDPVPIHPDHPYDSVVLAPPLALPESFRSVTLPDGRKVQLLCLYFLDAAERAQLTAEGWPRFCARLKPNRLSV